MKTYIAIVLIVFIVVSLNSYGSDENNIIAKDIMRMVNDKYSNLHSYKDKGVVKRKSKTIEFETYFVRPKLFRFDWITRHNLHGFRAIKIKCQYDYCNIWTDGFESFSYDSNREKTFRIKKEIDIKSAVAYATGISNGAAHNISRLLINEIGGLEITKLNNLIYIGEKIIGEEICFELQGRQYVGTICKIWISKEDYLIRKIQEVYPDDSIKDTYYNKVEYNIEIPSSIFKFKPRNNK